MAADCLFLLPRSVAHLLCISTRPANEFSETSGLQLEDIDHLFEKGGITGGVYGAKGGRTVEPGYHATHPNTEGIEKERYDAMGIEHKLQKDATLEMV